MEQVKRTASSIAAPRPSGVRQQLFAANKRVRFEVDVNYAKELVKGVEKLTKKHEDQSANMEKIIEEQTTKLLDEWVQKKGNPFLKKYKDGEGGFENPTKAMTSKKVNDAIKK